MMLLILNVQRRGDAEDHQGIHLIEFGRIYRRRFRTKILLETLKLRTISTNQLFAIPRVTVTVLRFYGYGYGYDYGYGWFQLG